MELKEMTEQIKILFDVDDVEAFPSRILQTLQAPECDVFFDSYLNLVGNLEVDWLQKCYQFFLADRGKDSKQQDYTPATLSSLVAQLVKGDNNKIIYDYCSGSGSLTIATWKQFPMSHFICHELDGNVIPFLLFNLSIRNISATVVHGDVLKGTIESIYDIVPGNKYSKVTRRKEINFDFPMADICISNPPFNIAWSPDSTFKESTFRFPIPPEGNANYAFVFHGLRHLKNDGKLSVILPCGSLTSKTEMSCRQYLIKENLLDSIVVNPQRMFESTDIATCIMTFCKYRTSSPGVMMIDAKEASHEEKREQRGEAHNSKRIYTKAFNVFSEEDIRNIYETIKFQKAVQGFSAFATADKFADNEYDFLPSRYIELSVKNKKSRSFDDIAADLVRVIEERNAVKITMNEKLAKDLGWDSVADIVDKGYKNTEAINSFLTSTLHVLPLPKSSYISLTRKGGEIKIENTSKTSVSTIFSIILPMLRQHIMYLNDEENRLLAELRDTLLPRLMSGEIDVSDCE